MEEIYRTDFCMSGAPKDKPLKLYIMKSHIVNAALAAAAFLSAAGCGMREPDYDACGQINATEVIVSAESSGRLISFAVTEGDRLKAGECAGQIDSVQTWLQKEELLSRKQSAEVKTVDVECQTRAQYARLENLKNELKRSRDLLEKDAGTQKQVDDLESEISVLEGQIAAAEQNYRQNNESVRAEMATLDVQIAQTEDKLRKCRIIAPVSGTVLEKYAEEGESVTSGRQLFKIADMDNLYVKAYFPSARLAGLHVGDKVKVIPDDGTAEPAEYEGTVTWISDEAEFTPKNIQTRDERADLVYAVKVAVRNDGSLRLGMYAYVII